MCFLIFRPMTRAITKIRGTIHSTCSACTACSGNSLQWQLGVELCKTCSVRFATAVLLVGHDSTTQVGWVGCVDGGDVEEGLAGDGVGTG